MLFGSVICGAVCCLMGPEWLHVTGDAGAGLSGRPSESGGSRGLHLLPPCFWREKNAPGNPLKGLPASGPPPHLHGRTSMNSFRESFPQPGCNPGGWWGFVRLPPCQEGNAPRCVSGDSIPRPVHQGMEKGPQGLEQTHATPNTDPEATGKRTLL